MMKKGKKCNFVFTFYNLSNFAGSVGAVPDFDNASIFSRMQKLDECIFIFISVQTMLKMPEIFEK